MSSYQFVTSRPERARFGFPTIDRIALIAALALALVLGACADDATGEASGSEPAPSADGRAAADAASADLGPVVERAPLQDAQMVTFRGAMRWRAPSGWTEKDTSGKPFVTAEYYLPGHSDEQPTMCRIRNGSAPKEGTDDAAIADKRVGDVRVKTVEGKSLRSQVERERRELGQFTWAIGTADGAWYDDGTIVKPRDPVFIVEDYTGLAAAPVTPGPPFVVNCWGPRPTIASQRSTIEAWLASIELEPI